MGIGLVAGHAFGHVDGDGLGLDGLGLCFYRLGFYGLGLCFYGRGFTASDLAGLDEGQFWRVPLWPASKPDSTAFGFLKVKQSGPTLRHRTTIQPR